MTRRAKAENAPPEEPRPSVAALPSQAGTLEELIDLRFRDVLSLASDAKELVKALEAASAWVKIRRDVKEPEWGGQLGRTMR
jgi:hypothetical protein